MNNHIVFYTMPENMPNSGNYQFEFYDWKRAYNFMMSCTKGVCTDVRMTSN